MFVNHHLRSIYYDHAPSSTMENSPKPPKQSKLELIGNMRHRLELTDEGFDFSVLSEWRQRLISDGQTELEN